MTVSSWKLPLKCRLLLIFANHILKRKIWIVESRIIRANKEKMLPSRVWVFLRLAEQVKFKERIYTSQTASCVSQYLNRWLFTKNLNTHQTFISKWFSNPYRQALDYWQSRLMKINCVYSRKCLESRSVYFDEAKLGLIDKLSRLCSAVCKLYWACTFFFSAPFRFFNIF